MSTKTMRPPPRRAVTATNGKRRGHEEEEDGRLNAVKPSASKKPKTESDPDQTRVGSAPNQLLAGYLAHEFLTCGTLFGQPWDPTRSDTDSNSGSGSDLGLASEPPCPERRQRYVAVADLISVDGSHLPGVVNPTQLARLLQL